MIGKVGFTQSANYLRETSSTGVTKAPEKPASNVELSEDMRTLNAVKASMANTQDLDMDKVAAMKAMLKSGNMSVNLDNLANSIINYYEPTKK